MSFNDFVHEYKLKKSFRYYKKYEVLKKTGLDSKVGIYLRDVDFSTNYGIVNLHPSRGSHWVLYVKKNFVDSFGCAPPRKLSKFIIKRNGHCLYSEYKIQGLTNKRGSYCASYCLYIIYSTQVIGIDFISAVLNLYYQMI